MKKSFLLLLITFYIANLYPADQQINLLSTDSINAKDGAAWMYRNRNYISSDTNLSKEKLTSTVWTIEEDIIGYNYAFIFYLDNVFRTCYFPGAIRAEGRYGIVGNKVILFDIKSKDDQWNRKDYLLTFVTSSKNMFKHGLVSDKLSIYPLGGEKEFGESFIYNNFELERMGGYYVNPENSKIYRSPSTKMKPIETHYYGFNYLVDVYIDMVIQGDKLRVLGRFKDKKNHKYWNLAILNHYNSSDVVWFQSNNLETYDESKKNLYDQLLQDGFILAGWDGVSDDPNFLP